MSIDVLVGLSQRKSDFPQLFERYAQDVHITQRLGRGGAKRYFLRGEERDLEIGKMDALYLLVQYERKVLRGEISR